MSYIESSGDPVQHKHLQRGQAAILIDAIGPHMTVDMFMCSITDNDMCGMIAGTILLMDEEEWVRGLPKRNVTVDQDTMKISPSDGVYITIDRHVMTPDGFIPRRNLPGYHAQRLIDKYRELSGDCRLFMVEDYA